MRAEIGAPSQFAAFRDAWRHPAASGDIKLDRFDGVIPELEGEAYLCGFANGLVDDRDPLTYGFLVR